MSKNKPILLEAEINIIDSTEDLMREVASIVEFPKNKTPDMLFFTGCFVSSGENLNHAYFMPSELVKSFNSIINKPLDIEHEEDVIVGHIYSSAFVDQSGNKLELETLSTMDEKALDMMDLDIIIGGIIYKSRFPEMAEEVTDDKWKLSMETYFQDYDIKVGNLIMSRQEAEVMGLASFDNIGRIADIIKGGVQVASGEIARVLRDLMFSGCGLVEKPANPRSLIFTTAAESKNKNKEAILVDLDKIDGVGDIDIPIKKTKKTKADISAEDIRSQTSIGICVSYKKYLYANEPVGPDTEILHENWCTLYESGCTSFGRDTTDPNCLRNQIAQQAASYAESKLLEMNKTDKRGGLLKELKKVIKKI